MMASLLRVEKRKTKVKKTSNKKHKIGKTNRKLDNNISQNLFMKILRATKNSKAQIFSSKLYILIQKIKTQMLSQKLFKKMSNLFKLISKIIGRNHQPIILGFPSLAVLW
jgi:putative cell wall-binding protein